MQKQKSFVLTIIAIAICFSLLSVPAFAEEGSKVLTAGDETVQMEESDNTPLHADSLDITWTISDDVLTISGTGDMTEVEWSGYGRSIYKVIIEEGVKSICNNAFDYCEYLTEVTIPGSVVSIGDLAFSHCQSLKEIILPEGVESINRYAFSGCESLASIVIPNTIKNIGKGAFNGCTSLAEIKYSGSDEQWNQISIDEGNDYFLYIKNGFGVCGDGLTWRIADTTLIISGTGDMYDYNDETKYSDAPWDDLSLVISRIIIEDGVTSIGSGAFKWFEQLETIIIPAEMKQIGVMAFYDCIALKDVFFHGSEDRWKKIVIEEEGNKKLLSADVHFNYSGENTLKSIVVKTLPSKILYNTGELLDISGLIITANYSDDTVKDITSGLTFSPKTLSTVGQQTITVTYEGKTATFKVIVKEKEPNEPVLTPVEEFVARLYKTLLGREYDASGLNAWTGVLINNKATGAKVVYKFVYSEEFQANPLNNIAFVTAMYETILGREPDRSGLDAWVKVLENGCTRKKVLAGFVNSGEMKALCDDMGIEAGSYHSDEVVDKNSKVTFFVSRMYRCCLGREADFSGLTTWVSALLDGKATGTKIAKGFFSNSEMKNMGLSNREYVERAYVALLDRQPDKNGWDAWTEILDKSGDQNKIVKGFVGSDEFGKLCTEYGITK